MVIHSPDKSPATELKSVQKSNHLKTKANWYLVEVLNITPIGTGCGKSELRSVTVRKCHTWAGLLIQRWRQLQRLRNCSNLPVSILLTTIFYCSAQRCQKLQLQRIWEIAFSPPLWIFPCTGCFVHTFPSLKLRPATVDQRQNLSHTHATELSLSCHWAVSSDRSSFLHRALL